METIRYRVTAQHAGSFQRFGTVLESNIDSSPDRIRAEVESAFPGVYDHVIVERLDDAR